MWESVETMDRALHDCKWAQFFFESFRPSSGTNPGRANGMLCWLDLGVFSTNSPHFKSLVMTHLRASWYAKNMHVFQDKDLAHIECFGLAHKDIWDKSSVVQRNGHEVCRRRSVSQGVWKICVDAVIQQGREIRVGVVVFNIEQRDVSCRYLFRQEFAAAKLGKCMAIKEWMQLALDDGKDNIIIIGKLYTVNLSKM